jgi:Fic-DOC domain mobile mystery protein B
MTHLAPLEEDERTGLLIPTILTRHDLDHFEQANMVDARLWYQRNHPSSSWLLSGRGVRGVHQRMFGEVWDWAGTFRLSEKNLGVDPVRIATDLEILLGDVHHWLDNETFSPDEIAVRFKHRLVSIHCFANGNGRHARLMADLLVHFTLVQPMFSWGGDVSGAAPHSRKRYIDALQCADRGDISSLLEFARS